MDDIWFQQDRATCHIANVTIDLLCTVFQNRIISRNSDVNSLAQSCDLTPLDYFLWGAVTDKFHANHPETIEALKHEIEVAIHGIERQTIENVLQNWVDRIRYCKASNGSHLNDYSRFKFQILDDPPCMSMESWGYQKDGKRSLNKMENISFIVFKKMCLIYMIKSVITSGATQYILRKYE